MIVHKYEPISLIGGAIVDKSRLKQALELAPTLIAADGGADQALKLGHEPQAVIGDFDSISDQARAQLPSDALHHIAEQDSTDFDKCLRSIDAPLIIGVGFLGARLDHQMAAFNSLVCHPGRRCVLVGETELVFLAPPHFNVDAPEGTIVSLFPMGAVEGVSDGLRWPINGLRFSPDGRVSTSNLALGPFEVTLTAPKMLVILPATLLAVVVQSLLQTPSHWEQD